MIYLPPFIEYRSNKISDYDITQSSIGYVKHITNTELNPKIRFHNYLKQLDESTLSVNE
jgi:glutathione-regulated potassium-efflux system ancillary protein KefG